MRRARREHALAPGGAARRQHLGTPPRVPVEPVDHPDAFPAGQILDRVFQVPAWEQLDHGLDRIGNHRLARGLVLVRKGRVHDPDGLQRQGRVVHGRHVAANDILRWP